MMAAVIVARPVSAVERPVLPLWAALLAAALAGPVFDASFPEVSIWPLPFVAIAIVLVGLIGRSAWSSAAVGFVFGTTFYLVNLDFTAHWVGPLPWVALSVLEALIVAGGSVLITLAYRWLPRVAPSAWARLVLLPLLVGGLWVTREIVAGSFPYGGFPWGRVGTSQVNGPFAEALSWIGTLGVTFLVVAAVASLVEWVRLRCWRNGVLRAALRALPAVGTVVVLIVVPAWATTPAGTLSVASVQGNGPAGYFDERQAGDVMRSQLIASEPLLDTDGIDVMLWPEGGVDLDPFLVPESADALDALSRRIDAPLVVNAITMREDEFFNTSILWRAGEGAVDTYDKRNPVPFGEYVPDRGFYAGIAPDLIGMIGRDYTPGTNPPVFDLGETIAGLAICFDVIYDALIWEGAQDGAQVYLFQTNNADFRGTDENLQQLAVARLRAIETGRAVVNLSTVGTSQVIAPDGTTIDGLPAGEPGHMLTDVPLRAGLTPAVAGGPWITAVLGWGSVAVLGGLGIVVLWRRRRDAETPAPAGAGVPDETIRR